jgi:type IV secretion system protein VirB9
MVFDNGKKTYIKMPDSIQQANMPVLFIREKGKNDLVLVNYRIKGNFYIIDRLIDTAELRVSDKEVIKIERTNN